MTLSAEELEPSVSASDHREEDREPKLSRKKLHLRIDVLLAEVQMLKVELGTAKRAQAVAEGGLAFAKQRIAGDFEGVATPHVESDSDLVLSRMEEYKKAQQEVLSRLSEDKRHLMIEVEELNANMEQVQSMSLVDWLKAGKMFVVGYKS